MCDSTIQMFQDILTDGEPGMLPQGLASHVWACASCRDRLTINLPVTRVVLSRRALALALPLGPEAAATMRGESESVFVLFDGTEGDPPRQLTVVVREASATTWEMRVTAAPPVTGVFLMTIGVQNFAGRFRDDGSATISRIPAGVLTDPDAPSLEIAILPIGA
ncbi:MAG: hypothetical protein HGA45_10125 [Chloroflexales bacterium]|nr:hypothetical protein [Chloroflexales bacterium]